MLLVEGVLTFPLTAAVLVLEALVISMSLGLPGKPVGHSTKRARYV